MRIIETFTSLDVIKSHAPNEEIAVRFSKKVFSYLIEKNYYENVRKMMDDKINDNTYDEITTKPRTEISRVILEMIERPLKLVNTLKSDDIFDSKILTSFVNEILSKESNYTISNFIIPSLSADVNNFPYIKLINFLYDVHTKRNHENNYSGGRSKIQFNGFLLYSILHLDEKHLDNIVASNFLQHYLIVIGSMIGCISKLPKSNEYLTKFSHYDEDDDTPMTNMESDSEDEDDNDEIMQPQFERLILMNIISALNDENRVNKIVRNIEPILHLPNVIHSVCVIAHNLMIYNRAAINEYR
jgi:hypothetical protein